jgi:hypothetical protein
MAFNDGRLAQARRLQTDDQILLYAGKRVFRTSSRSKTGLVVGEATVRSEICRLEQPTTIGTGSYGHVVDISIERLAPLGKGVALSAHLDELELFPDPGNWTSRIRRTVVSLCERDAVLLTSLLARVATDPKRVLREYEELVDPAHTGQHDRPSGKQAPILEASEGRSWLLDLLA